MLGRWGSKATVAVPDLISLLQNQQVAVDNVAEALARIAPENPEVIAAILKALEDRSALREDVVAALKIIGPPAGAAVPQLRKLLSESTGLLQRDILKALGAMEELGKPAIPDIVRYLTDENKSTREAAASAIGNLKQYAEPVLADLVKLLKDPEEDVQLQVLWSLERIGPVAKAVIPEVEKFVATTSNEELKKEGGRLLTRLKADPN
jgi:HEAT repeat protein